MGSVPLILSLETATPGGSFCLTRGGRLLASRSGDPGISHSNCLLQYISEILEETKLSLEDVDMFAAATGPGSFTGLRIGLATIKALASTLERSCIGVPTLEAIASAAGPSEATVALLPAGRGELFVQLFSVTTEKVTPLDQAEHLSPQKTVELYDSRGRLVWAGEGAQIHRGLIEGRARDNWGIAPVETNLAIYVAKLAMKKFERGEVTIPELLTAIYVRPSDAELNVNVIRN